MHKLPEGNIVFLFGRALHRAWVILHGNTTGTIVVVLFIVAMVFICDGILTRIARDSEKFKL